MAKFKRVGILTGGGDCPGLNAVIRMVAKKSIREHGAEVVGIRDGFDGLIHQRSEPLTFDSVGGILARGGTILGTTNRANPFAYEGKDVSDQVVAYFQELKLDVLFCVGGDGTQSIADGLRQKGVPMVGIPKTIDNDIVGTEVSFGFDTAVSVCTRAIDDLHTTAESHGRVLVVEVMGRHAGWIALTAGVAGGADVILLPEIPFDLDQVSAFIRKRHESRHCTIVCIAEGAHARGASAIHKRKGVLGGISVQVALDIEKQTGLETRTVILGHLQRSGSPTAADRILASRFAAGAVDLALAEKFGHMIAQQNGALTSVAIESVANKTRCVSLDHELVRMGNSLGTNFGRTSIA